MRKRLFSTVVLFGVLCLGIGTSFAQPPDEFKILAGDGATNDRFGESVSISGDVAIVGARNDDDSGDNSGSAYVFRRVAGSWIEEAKLTASDGAGGDFFGESVSISGDVAIVGAHNDRDIFTSSGSAYVFRLVAGSWIEEAKLTASDGAIFDQFGKSVSISGDVAIVGARAAPAVNNGPRTGSAYVFRFDGISWIEETKLTASDAAEADTFGGTLESVSISGDVAIVGANNDDDSGTSSGSAYVFRLVAGSWTEESKLTASDAAEGDLFGLSVSISGDVAIVGASFDDDSGPNSGSAYVFRLVAGSWIEEAKLTASDGAIFDLFGWSVSISGDVAIVGAFGDDDNGSISGSAYVFRLVGGSWMEESKLTASDGEAVNLFGRSVSIRGDVAIVGAFGDGDNGQFSGSAYIYSFNQPPAEATQDQVDVLQDIVDTNPGTPLADKIQDAVDKLQTALTEFDKTPPDNQAAVGNIEGAVGELEAAVNDGLLDAVQGVQLMDKLAGIARQMAADALDEAIAQSGDPGEINDAQQALSEGDGLRTSEAFKDAVNKYKDALSKAESAQPPASKPAVVRVFHPTDPSIPDDLKDLLGLEGQEGLWLLDPELVDGLNAQDNAIEWATVQTLQFELQQNHPNPFNPATTIHYTLSEATQVRLTIYNVLGQSVRELVNNGQGAGVYRVTWDGRNSLGKAVTSGVYFYRLKAGANVSVRKMILTK